MENYEEEIKKFDALEEGKASSDSELDAIQKTDALIKKGKGVALGPDFTNRVLSSGFAFRRKKKQNRFFTLLAGIFIGFFALLLMLLRSEPSGDTAVQMTPMLDRLNIISEWMANEKLRQLLLIVQAIIVLLIVDQFVSRRSIFRSSSH